MVIAAAARGSVQPVQEGGRILFRQPLLVEPELQSQLVHVGGRVEGLEVKRL